MRYRHALPSSRLTRNFSLGFVSPATPPSHADVKFRALQAPPAHKLYVCTLQHLLYDYQLPVVLTPSESYNLNETVSRRRPPLVARTYARV